MDAKAELVEMLPKLRRFALGLTGAPDRADDLVQAACLKALERWHQWRPGTSLRSWLFRIVQTTWIDQKRFDARRPTTSEESVLHSIADDAQSGAPELKRLLGEVMEEVLKIPEDQRVALLLVTVEGLSYQEAADCLQVPIGTVMSRLSRARRRLADRFGGVGLLGA
ncbi:MAG: sigma-70 family RNA polymerase sigma factor [Pseudomonadota bacterium]